MELQHFDIRVILQREFEIRDGSRDMVKYDTILTYNIHKIIRREI